MINKAILLAFIVCLPISALADRGTSAKIATSTATGSNKADACDAALKRVSAGQIGFLEQMNRIERIEKKCDCEQESKDTKTSANRWTCMGTISYTEKQ